ncbi:hypothetical protein QYE76_070469 [Lolium multiflorum]|uniref:50S ribosomal protein L18, chloroplastic n=1 Tax=Lolium multiflorum TaxID=4521 RepID=A0AAD8SJ01_LOLMU|nr:hypothetical protein QYE76_070469 [Lolium multiflorum]
MHNTVLQVQLCYSVMLLVSGGEHDTVLERGGQCTLYCGVIKIWHSILGLLVSIKFKSSIDPPGQYLRLGEARACTVADGASGERRLDAPRDVVLLVTATQAQRHSGERKCRTGTHAAARRLRSSRPPAGCGLRHPSPRAPYLRTAALHGRWRSDEQAETVTTTLESECTESKSFGNQLAGGVVNRRVYPRIQAAARHGARTENAKVRNRRHQKKFNGTATKPRLSVFCSNKQLYAMLVDDHSKRMMFYASTLQEVICGDPPCVTVEAARRVGEELVKACKELDISEVSCYDRNGFARGEKMMAFEDPIAQHGFLPR